MKPLSLFANGWAAISVLLDEALGLPPSARAAWLDALAGEQAPHREALRALLLHQSAVETGDFLNGLPSLKTPAPEAPKDRVGRGSRVGPYRLVAELGQGGMATVWLAERADGMMSRQVALKLPRIAWGARHDIFHAGNCRACSCDDWLDVLHDALCNKHIYCHCQRNDAAKMRLVANNRC